MSDKISRAIATLNKQGYIVEEEVSLKEIAEETGDDIVIRYVPLENLKDTFLDGNSKKHDTAKIIESIRRYGFKDPIAFDSRLNEGRGGIIEGNGRLESLIEMKNQGLNLPRGLKENWQVPVVFGVNATSEAEAVAFSIEHNWSVLWGSDLSSEQISSIFEDSALEEQLQWLKSEESLPLSVEDNLDELMKSLDEEETEDAAQDFISTEWGIIVNLENEQQQLELLEKLSAEGYKCKALM